MALTPPVPHIPVSRAVRTLERGCNGLDFCADVAANAVAEHNSNKRAIMKQHYIAKASLVGLTLAEYCRRFGIRGIV